MTPEFALDLAQEAVRVALYVAAPVIGLSLLVGLIISLFQATTQVHEPSLQFVPKILAAVAGLVVFGPWMLTTLMDFARRVMDLLPRMVR
ncbi:flagellar biosynthesis protein FliQ [Symbiobacterium thermophilum]|uniref:Flagellar biosynthetic protein FliQ n=1 Tax=Symbiobacterium thermophilum (strain DSM 24528 / JCM 14929 / IAM 14863 / T) TaxID=292459 RepID=Q3V816_SYMTH|nr:flagellar biosynthesis protein FliQ [Symbiobacterium thermophilum]BAD41973.1 flagellar biosynthetic protein [Symbiobacterium thermophilum IAM 14863]